jgi:long-chain acyl-CoA synthetase
MERVPNNIAWEFHGIESSYRDFVEQVDLFADALFALGCKKGEVITIAMPTAPNGIIPIYAANKIGVVCSMIHPLTPANQIKKFLNLSNSKYVLTLDVFYWEFESILEDTSVTMIILNQIQDYLEPVSKMGLWSMKKDKLPKVPLDPRVHWVKDLTERIYPKAPLVDQNTDDCAIILYSGGIMGEQKAIQLSNYNMIAQGMATASWGESWANPDTEDKILALLPIFHGFGLAVCVNAAFMAGATSVLVPDFNPKTVAKLVATVKPNVLVGVPTLFEALANSKDFNKTDLSCLKFCFSGADSLPRSIKEKFEQVVKNGGGSVELLEGYGLTEAVAAVMAIPIKNYREGSIGIPFPDTLIKIVQPSTLNELAIGELGEIVISGPTVMLGYLNNPAANARMLAKDEEGKIWLHTGDLATQDADGFFYFKKREKRMFKVSGFNCYPVEVEKILKSHPAVDHACVIGIPDALQMSRVKAFIILKNEAPKTPEMIQNIQEYCLANLLRWESPREIIIRESLPQTSSGDLDCVELEKEELIRLKDEKKYPFN